jgi:predicted negative regulator of RcsB-dependent stress response
MVAQTAAHRSRNAAHTAGDDDVVLARALELADWARRNVVAIVAVAVVAAVLVGGFFFYRANRANRLERAANELAQIEQMAAAGNTTLAAEDLEKFAQTYNGTVYADEARMTAAQIHLSENQPARAVALLQGAAGRIGDSPVGPQAALLLGAAQEATGDVNAAVETYQRVAREAPLAYQKQDALLAAASLREEKGEYAAAADIYRQLVAGAEAGSPERSVFEMRLIEAEARSAAPAAAAAPAPAAAQPAAPAPAESTPPENP